VVAPSVISRQQWKAAPFRGTVSSLGAIKHVVVHHAAGFRAGTQEEGKKQVREIQRLHQSAPRNWSDIGYHFLVDSSGTIYQGRPYFKGSTLDDLPRMAVGAHVLAQNMGKVGICLLGCFHPPEVGCNDKPSEQALASLERLTRFICANYSVPASSIKTHRDFLSTSCPGDTLFAAVAAMRERIAQS